MTNSPDKGKGGEREWAKFCREHGFPEARRGKQYAGHEDAPDCVKAGPEGWFAEVKRVQALNLQKAWDKAVEDAGPDQKPYVAHRKNYKDWLVTLRAEDFLELLQGQVLVRHIEPVSMTVSNDPAMLTIADLATVDPGWPFWDDQGNPIKGSPS